MPMDAKLIKELRLKRGLTQQQVADVAGMAQANYARIESGIRSDPVFSTAEKIADALGVPLDKLRVKKGRPRKPAK